MWHWLRSGEYKAWERRVSSCEVYAIRIATGWVPSPFDADPFGIDLTGGSRRLEDFPDLLARHQRAYELARHGVPTTWTI